MSFFQDSKAVTIHGGDFKSFTITPESADFVTQLLQKRKERDDSGFDADDTGKRRRYSNKNLDGLKTVREGDIILGREMISGNGYRIHYASYKKRVVLVKTFEGLNSTEDWLSEVTLAKGLFHPNVLKMVGISSEGSETPFVVFHGVISEQRMQLMIANALATDLNLSIQLSMKVVKGLAAALHYMKSKGKISLHRISEDFHIFVGYDDEPIIAFHLRSTFYEGGLQSLDIEDDDCDILALNGICKKIFSESTSLLHGDSPDRKISPKDAEYAMTGIPTDLAGWPISSDSEAASELAALSGLLRSPRREVCWVDLDRANQSLESIKRCFEDCLDRFLLSSSNQPLRHINASKVNHPSPNSHPCSGYLRLEITLTSDISKSAIVSHSFPSQSERCSTCGQIVQYTSTEEKAIDSSSNVIPPALSSTVLSSVDSREDESPNHEIKSSDMPCIESDGVSTFGTTSTDDELVVGRFRDDVDMLDSSQMSGVGESLVSDDERDLQDRTENPSSEVETDGLVVMAAEEIDLRKELLSGNKYRIYSASHEGRIVAVKHFEDKQKWAVNLRSKRLRHPHIAEFSGVSAPLSESPFVVFKEVSDQRMQSILAKALRTDLRKSVQISMKSVQALASALDYMNNLKIPLHPAWKTFDLLAGSHQEPLIACNWPSTVYDNGGRSYVEDDGSGLKALNGLCQKLFWETNAILDGCYLRRNLDANAAARLLTSAQSSAEVTSGISEGQTSSDLPDSLKAVSGDTPLREVWWIDLGDKNESLDSIQRRFYDYMSHSPSFSNASPLRRIRPPDAATSSEHLHRFPGYLREEITLTSDVTRCAIISHECSSQSESCPACGYLCTVSNTRQISSPEDGKADMEGSPDEMQE